MLLAGGIELGIRFLPCGGYLVEINYFEALDFINSDVIVFFMLSR